MSKVILTVVTINLGLMGAARLPFPQLLVATTRPENIGHPTPSPTATPEFPSIPNPSPTPSPIAVETEGLAATVTHCRNFAGANFRTVPSLDNAAIADVIPCDASVVLTGNQIRSDGEVWLETEWNGQRGWVAQVMLTPPQQTTIQVQPPTREQPLLEKTQ